ncbi:MAG: hypothetical protein DMG76_26445 [Acidobacteria bacterium]|nr:MAG: hypothetical protein DMG76_26445 [Acidobacteriota bacterium]
MGAFGLVRTLPLWIMYRSSKGDDRPWAGYIETLGAWQPIARFASACSLMALGGFFLAALWSLGLGRYLLTFANSVLH